MEEETKELSMGHGLFDCAPVVVTYECRPGTKVVMVVAPLHYLQAQNEDGKNWIVQFT